MRIAMSCSARIIRKIREKPKVPTVSSEPSAVPKVSELARGLEPLTLGLQIRCSTS